MAKGTMVGLVIVADGDENIRTGYREVLQAAHFTVVEAPDGESAVARCKQLTPHIVVLGVHMPGISGIETCKRIRGAIGVDVPIIFVTRDSTPSVLQECLAAGGNDFYFKGGAAAEILKRVRMWEDPRRRSNIDAKRRKAIQRVADVVAGRAMIPSGRRVLDALHEELGLLDPADDWDLDDSTALPLDEITAWKPTGNGASPVVPPALATPAPVKPKKAAKPAGKKQPKPIVRRNSEMSWGDSPASAVAAAVGSAGGEDDSLDWEGGGLFGGDTRAVSVPTETAGHKISVGTQCDSAFPRFHDREKRSRAVSVPTETAGHEMSVGTQCDSAFPRFHDREKRSSLSPSGGNAGPPSDSEDDFWALLDNPAQDGEVPGSGRG